MVENRFFGENPGFEKLGNRRKTRFLDQKTRFSIEKHRLLMRNPVFDRKTGFFTDTPRFSLKNWVSRLKNRVSRQNWVFWSKHPVFQICLINLVFRLARNPVFWSKNWGFFRRKPGFSIYWTLSLPYTPLFNTSFAFMNTVRTFTTAYAGFRSVWNWIRLES